MLPSSLLRAGALMIALASVARADSPTQPAVNGKLTHIDGVPILKVWGTPHERGHAHGYLLANEIRNLLTGYLAETRISGGPARFEETGRLASTTMLIQPRYKEELQGMLDGLGARLKGETTISALGRSLKLRDLIAINCIPDYVGFGCSSFTAWGNLTKGGRTLVGRNLDWHPIEALTNSQMIFAIVPEADSDQRAWVSVTCPGMIGCLTGMNADGVTVSMHDVVVDNQEERTGYTPRGFILREAIESARAGSVRTDIAKVLKKRRSIVGNNVPVAMPFHGGKKTPSLVFEYDGHTERGDGLTMRRPASRKSRKKNGDFQVATNHYCKRGEPQPCNRYKDLERLLKKKRKQTSGKKAKVSKLTPKRMWPLLRKVAVSGNLITYHSVVFEPNRLRMHVAFTHAGTPAPESKPITLDIERLLSHPVQLTTDTEADE